MTEKQDYLSTLSDGLDQASQPIEMQAEPESADYITLSTGVVLHLRKIAPRIILQVLEKFKPPQVPMVHDPEKERAIENPQDPRYIAESEQYLSERGFALLDACIALGTELESVPANTGLPTLESQDWIDELAMSGIEFDVSRPRIRYTMWVKTVAAVTEQDLLLLSKYVMRKAGVTKEDVGTALDSFRS